MGKVKTRLARSIGAERALSVYQKLLEVTKAITEDLPLTRQVAYSDFVPENDIWAPQCYVKTMQKGEDLGERMSNAMMYAFRDGHQRVCIIGSDSMELRREIIEEAFVLLKNHDVVLGPAKDGGYYLIGMNTLHERIFQDKNWGTNTVLSDTIVDLNRLKLSHALLPELNDIDMLEDIREQDRDYLLS